MSNLWLWSSICAVLLVLEAAFAASFFFVFWALAALLLIIITQFFSLTLATQIVIFSFLSAINITLWLKKKKKRPAQPESDEADKLNNRSAALVGNIYTLSLPIEQGATRMEIAGSQWTVCGADLAAGTRVKVVKVVGLELFVEAI